MEATATLVGREAELQRLEEALDALEAGSPSILAIEGEPGIGKTRLLDELRARGEKRGHLVLSGSAAEFERDVPYSVWVDALDAYVASQQLGELAAELGEILPSMRVAGEPAAALADERYRAHRAVQSLLTALSDDQALVLVLDDLHWSDGASVELISSLVRRGTPAPVLMALACRPSQAAPRLTAALASAGVTKLTLEPLTEEQARKLLTGVDAATAAALYRDGGGNPFYLEQLARSGVPAADTNGHHDGPLPPAVAASLAEELGSLSSQSRSLLDAAAVAGEPFEPGLAAAIGELPPSDGLTALDELLAADLVRPTRVPRRFVFRHPLVRRAVYESAPGGWRLAAHARAAAALAERGAGAAERAHHVEHSATQGEEDALALLIEAGRTTAARDPAASARWFASALRLLPSTDRERHVAVRLALAAAQRAQGDLEQCRSTLLEASELLPPDSHARRVELTARCAAVEHLLGRHEDAHRRLVWAWEDLPDRDTYEAAALQIELAADGLFMMDVAGTISRGRDALQDARRLGDRALIGGAAAILALGEAADGQVDDALVHRDEAVEQIGRLPDSELADRLDTLYFLGWADTYLERYDQAIEHADRGIAIARATGDGSLIVPLMLVKGYPYEMLGRLAEAIETCEGAVEAARLSANPHYLFWALFELGWARYFAGHLDEAVAACLESARVGGRLTGGTMPSVGGGPGTCLAVCRMESGEPARALAMMREVYETSVERWVPIERCFNWETLALAEIGLGNNDAAREYAARSRDDASGLPLHLPSALASRTLAAVLLADGDASGAAREAATSVAEATAAGALLEATYARALLGRALAAAGDRSEAVETLRAAEKQLDEYGSQRARDEVRRELRKLGVRAEPRGRATADDSGLSSLTEREREIAERVYDRMTNKQIAAALFLSEKTIESHMRNIFLKLEVTSRVAVARTIERERREQSV